MSAYTIGEIVIWLVLAAALGFALGWVARELQLRVTSSARDTPDVRPAVAIAEPEPEAPVEKTVATKAPAKKAPAKKAPAKKAPAKKAPAKKAPAKKAPAKKAPAKKTPAKKAPAKKAAKKTPATKATPPQDSDDT